MRFPPNFLDELRARLPVSEVVGRRVRLKKAGREWKGLSPFNKEKTPSFFVNDQKASWFDFSAGRNGDIFDFVMETEGVDFPEAVERLAAIASMPMPVMSGEAAAQEQHRRSLHDVIELAARFFEATLAARTGAKARGYLADRGIEPATQLAVGGLPQCLEQQIAGLIAVPDVVLGVDRAFSRPGEQTACREPIAGHRQGIDPGLARVRSDIRRNRAPQPGVVGVLECGGHRTSFDRRQAGARREQRCAARDQVPDRHAPAQAMAYEEAVCVPVCRCPAGSGRGHPSSSKRRCYAASRTVVRVRASCGSIIASQCPGWTTPLHERIIANRRVSTVLTLGIGWLLYVGKGIFVPIVLSVLVVYVIDGLARLLGRVPVLGMRLPEYVRYTLSIALIVVILVYVARMLMASLGNVVALAPHYEASLLNAIQAIAERLGVETAPTWGTLRRDLLAQISLQRVIGGTFVSVSAIAGSLVVVLLYGAFLLIEKRALAAKLERLSSDPGRVARLRRIVADVNGKIGAYLALKTVVSVVQGLVAWVVMALFDVQFAAFWAVLIGLLNYVPYLGTMLSILFPVAFAAMQFGDLGTVLTLLAALSVGQFVIGFFLDPWLMGSSLNLSPFVILVSVTVWAALWGIPGAFLAVPVTACMAMVFAEFPATRPIAVLLSRNGRLEPAA